MLRPAGLRPSQAKPAPPYAAACRPPPVAGKACSSLCCGLPASAVAGKASSSLCCGLPASAVAGKACSFLLAETVDAAEVALAVEIRLAAAALGAHHALAVEAGFRPGAVPIVVALRAGAPAGLLADPDTAHLALAAVVLPRAHDRALALPATVARKALLSAGLGRGRHTAPIAVAGGGIAVAERLVLAGTASLDDRRV